jgi:thiol:disulfide interchange protein DsbC
LTALFGSSAFAFREEAGSCVKCHSLGEKDVLPIFEKINLQGAKILDIRMSPVKGLWEVSFEKKSQRYVMYVDFAKKHVSPGPFIDYANRRDITRGRIEQLNRNRRIDTSKLSLQNALIIGEPDAPIKVIVFTDPGCSYCAKLHKEIKKVAEKRPDVVFFLKVFAVVNPDPQNAKSIVCARSLAMLEDAFEHKPVARQECQSTEVEDNTRFTQENGITGVPALILPDGSLQIGYLEATQLENRIDEAAGKAKAVEPARTAR